MHIAIVPSQVLVKPMTPEAENDEAEYTTCGGSTPMLLQVRYADCLRNCMKPDESYMRLVHV